MQFYHKTVFCKFLLFKTFKRVVIKEGGIRDIAIIVVIIIIIIIMIELLVFPSFLFL